MVQIRLTRRGQALAAKGSRCPKGAIVFRKDVFKMYTLKNTGEKVMVNESEIFLEKKYANLCYE